MEASDPLNGNSNGHHKEKAKPPSIPRGGPPDSCCPNPYTAHEDALSSPPPRSATDSPGFGGAAKQLLSAADALSPSKPYGGKYRGAEGEAPHRGRWAPSVDGFPFAIRYKQRRQTYGGDQHFTCWRSADHLTAGNKIPQPTAREVATLGGLRNPCYATLAQPGSLASDAWHSAPPTPAVIKPGSVNGKPDPPVWENLESAAKNLLKRATEAKPMENDEVSVKGLKSCVLGCRMNSDESITGDWMKRHLLTHVQLATARQKEDDYVKATVAVLLEDMCMDVEVPPPQRKLERQRMARAHMKPSKTAMGLQAGLIETKVTGYSSNLLVRRCSHDLAYGGCKGLKHPESIRRCDKCRSWFHVSCGQMVLGSGISCAEAVFESLCRMCSRVLIGGWGRDPGTSVQRQEALIHIKRREMLSLLERELDSGWPEGVFDLNLTIEPGVTRNARGQDGKCLAIPAIAKKDVRGFVMPSCAAKNCNCLARPDSRFCSDGCGVRNAQSLLSDALRHSLEERLGRERGRRLKEFRETRTLKHEIGQTLKKLQTFRPPAFKPQHEATLLGIVEKRRRLWKRLIEIGTYWEVVSGSKSLVLSRHPRQKATEFRRASSAGVGNNGTSVDSNRIKSSPVRKQGVSLKDVGDGVGDRVRDAGDQQSTRTVHAGGDAEVEVVTSMVAVQSNCRSNKTALGDLVSEIDVNGGESPVPRAYLEGGSSSDTVPAQGGGLRVSSESGGTLRNEQVSNTRNSVASDSKKRKSVSGEPVCSNAGQVPHKPSSSTPQRPSQKILRDGLQHVTCVYCGGATGSKVLQHLEQCYREAAALRNERLETATLLPKAKRRCTVPGTSPVSGPILPSESSADVGRQLLSRPVCYADFGDLPDPRLFQLHDDLKGWLCSPSRLDFLHKELIRQRNAAVLELDALDREEAELETQLRREWKEERRLPVHRTKGCV